MTAKMYLMVSILVLCGVMNLHAEVYRWTDENGKTHYGDQPFGKKKAEKVEIKSQAATKPDPELEAYRKETREQLRIADEERVAKLKELEKSRSAASPSRCAEAKDALRSSQESSVHYDLDKNGNRVFMKSEEIENYRAKLRSYISRNCR